MDNKFYNRHYITTRPDGTITDAWPDGPHPEKDTTNAICINGDGSQVVPRTVDEIAADLAAIPAPPPSAQEQLRADVDFIAAMTGVEF